MSRTASGQCSGPGCITCSDAAEWMRVEAIDLRSGVACCVDAAGRRSAVFLDLVPGVAIGSEVFVHAGVALCLPSRAHAERTEDPR